MGFTVTPTENGDFEVAGSNGSNKAVGYGYNADGEVDYFGPDSNLTDGADYDIYDDEPLAHVPFDQLKLPPLVDPNATQDQIVDWLTSPGEISQRDMQLIIEGMDQNGSNEIQRDLITECLAYKEGTVRFEQLSEEAQELLGVNREDVTTPTTLQEILESTDLDSVAAELGIESELEKISEDSRENLCLLYQSIALAEADGSLAGEQEQQAEQLRKDGDYAAALVSILSANFHAGKMTQADCIKEAVSKLGIKDALDAFSRLNYGYSATGSDTTYGRQKQTTDYTNNY